MFRNISVIGLGKLGYPMAEFLSSSGLSINCYDKNEKHLLDLKNYAADFDVQSNLIRVHSPSNLTQQESTKSARASAVRKKVELEDSVEPLISEIFRLYYISPAEAKSTLNELFKEDGNGWWIEYGLDKRKGTSRLS